MVDQVYSVTRLAMDVVCHLDVDEDDALWVSEHHGTRYFFCHPACKDLFDRDPDIFVD
jgi:YHS domain-containing protein